MTDPAALIVVDVQRGFDDADFWGPRDNPDCEANIARLLQAWRTVGWPVVFVRHDSVEAGSPLATGTPGNAFSDIITGTPDLLVRKQVNSAFHGSPDLHAWLVRSGLERIVVCGITTNHCCETTARVGGDLGLDVRFALDATHTFDRTSLDGEVIPAAHLSTVTATNLSGEFASVRSTAALLRDLGITTPPSSLGTQ